MPILQDVLAKLEEKRAINGVPVDLRAVTAELIEAGYTDAQVMHAIENLRAAKVLNVDRGRIILL